MAITRRIAASVALCALAAPFLAVAPVAAQSGPSTAPSPLGDVVASCPAATPGTAQCLALHRSDLATPATSGVTPNLVSGSLTPADIQDAYALPSATAGAGMTVAIVDAFDLPTAEADLAVYRSQFGLPPCTTANGCFRKVNQNGERISAAGARCGLGPGDRPRPGHGLGRLPAVRHPPRRGHGQLQLEPGAGGQPGRFDGRRRGLEQLLRPGVERRELSTTRSTTTTRA